MWASDNKFLYMPQQFSCRDMCTNVAISLLESRWEQISNDYELRWKKLMKRSSELITTSEFKTSQTLIIWGAHEV